MEDAILWHSCGPIRWAGALPVSPPSTPVYWSMLVYCARKGAGIGKIVAVGATSLNMDLGGSGAIDDDIPL